MTPEKDALTDDLLALGNMRDEDIDTSDIPEKTNFSGGVRGRYFDLAVREYDVRAIANWFRERLIGNGLQATSMWLNKIVYLAHEIALQEHRTLLTPAKVEAWDHGPVFREIHFQISKEQVVQPLLKFNPQSRRREVATENFDESDLDIFEKTWKRYGHLSASALRRITHEEGSPWHRVWFGNGGGHPGLEIDISLIIGQIGQGYGGKT